MEITLQPELEQFIQEKVTSGQYQSVNEAVNAGLKLLIRYFSQRVRSLKPEALPHLSLTLVFTPAFK